MEDYKELGNGCKATPKARAEEIVKFWHVVASDWLEYIYNVQYN